MMQYFGTSVTKTSVPLIELKYFRNSSTLLMNSKNGFQPLNPYECKSKTPIATVFTNHVICGFKFTVVPRYLDADKIFCRQAKWTKQRKYF